MATTLFDNAPVTLAGELPAVGSTAPDFTLTGADLEPVELSALRGKRVVLNIFPSIDTPTCAMSVRKFNQLAASLDNTVVVCVSKDLPFAQERFCGAHGIDGVMVASDFRSDFGQTYGVTMTEGPFEGLFARAIVVVGTEGEVLYEELVENIDDEPDYDKAVAALNA